jgi:peptidoglycan/xylan/chitin deacetylase (PgdA/CDA1 family)
MLSLISQGTLYNCIYSQATQLKATYAAGHQIASHTWTHPNLASLTAAQITTEMSKLEVAFANILGVKPTYMRPPSGATGGNVVSVMKSMGYRIVTWDIDSGDWNNVGVATSESRFSSANTGAGHIPLTHETIATTVNTLVPWVLSWAKGKGLQMVTVAECVGDVGGAYTTPVAKTGATSC